MDWTPPPPPVTDRLPTAAELAERNLDSHVGREWRLRIQAFEATVNFDGLRAIGTRVRRSQCTATHRIAQGGFHLVYILVFADGSDMIARLSFCGHMLSENDFPMPPHVLASNVGSEVAVISYLMENSTIPVPTVLAYDPTSHNLCGVPYMLQERVLGIELRHVWESMPREDRTRFLTGLAGIERQLLETPFNCIGSLYRYPSGFGVGPAAAPNGPFGVSYHEAGRGPWKSARAYLLDRIDNELQWMDQYPAQFHADRTFYNRDTSPIVLDRWRRYFLVLRVLVANLDLLDTCAEALRRNVLQHVDLSPANIFVDAADHTRIVAIIDWEFAIVAPLWTYPFQRSWIDGRDYGDTVETAQYWHELTQQWQHALFVDGLHEETLQRPTRLLHGLAELCCQSYHAYVDLGMVKGMTEDIVACFTTLQPSLATLIPDLSAIFAE